MTQHLEGDYGLYTWPCAPVLAQYVYSQRARLKGKRVLELGAGTAVPGIVAALCGADVILSDREGNPRLQDNLRRTCEINNVRVGTAIEAGDRRRGVAVGVVSKIMALSWGLFSQEMLGLPPQDIILASDCFYDTKDFEDILACVAFFTAKNPSCVFWTTYQDRSADRSLLPLLRRWNLCCRSIPLDSFYPPPDSEGHPREGGVVRVEGLSERILHSSHTIYMWEITQAPSSEHQI